MKISRETLDVILRCFNASSTDEIRPYINCVRINGTIVEATDGRILVRYNVEDNITKEDFSDILVSNSGFNKNTLKEFLKEHNFIHEFQYKIHEDSIEVIGTCSIFLKLIKGEYPNTSRIIPEYDEITIKFDFKLLQKITKAIFKSKDRQYITFKIKDANSAIEVIFDEDNKKAVLMPVRF